MVCGARVVRKDTDLNMSNSEKGENGGGVVLSLSVWRVLYHRFLGDSLSVFCFVGS